jgi:hypothetical protein
VEHQQDVALNDSVHEQFMDADQFEDAEEEDSDDLLEEGNDEERRGVEKHEEEETKEMVDSIGKESYIVHAFNFISFSFKSLWAYHTILL